MSAKNVSIQVSSVEVNENEEKGFIVYFIEVEEKGFIVDSQERTIRGIWKGPEYTSHGRARGRE